MKSKQDQLNGSTNNSDNNNNNNNSNNNGAIDVDDSMSDGANEEGRSRSGSMNRNEHDVNMSKSSDKVDHDALSIYIGNVDYSATEEELRNTFISCGEIVRVTIIKNMKTGHPKGAAFIEFTDKEGVQAAMGLNGREVKGRPLIVTSKKPRPENRPREARPQYNNNQQFDRRPPRTGPPHYAAPHYGVNPQQGGRGAYGMQQQPRGGGGGGGGGGYYHGGGGGGGGGGMPNQMDNRRNHPNQMQMQMEQARMQPRYDPYRRPDFYDPYMMQRSAAGPPPPPPPYYHHHHHHQDKMGGGNNNNNNNSNNNAPGGVGGGGGGHHSRTSQPQPQRYSNPFNNRR